MTTPTPLETLRTEQIFFCGTHHFEALIHDIYSAEDQINIETYSFHNDHLGLRIATALADAARRGVQVRIMVDGAGSPYWTTSFARMLERAGVVTKVFHPFPWQLWNWSRAVVKLPWILQGLYFLLKINCRNHRKVCIIDRHIVYVGSFNISKCHLDYAANGDNWRDTSVRLTNMDCNEIEKAFDAAWYHRTIPERLREAFMHIRNEPTIRLNYTRHRRRILYKNLLRRLAHCTNRIWITNAYFVPDNVLLRHLKEAARRGVDVRILLPKKSDIVVMPWASSTFYDSLLRAGVKIFEYLPSMLHAKTLILDNWTLVGSSNLNHRSVLHDLEVDVSIENAESKTILIQQFLKDLTVSREISQTHWHLQRPLRQRMLGRVVLYLKYWI